MLVSWAEALASAEASDPSTIDTVVANARTRAAWRAEFGLTQPTGALSDALDALGGEVVQLRRLGRAA